MELMQYGMVGGGPDGNIGSAHRKALKLSGAARLTAGCFSRHEDKNHQMGSSSSAASRYEGVLCQTILQKKQALPHADCRVETALAESILTLNGELLDDTVALKTALETAPETDGEHMLRYYHDTIFAQMNKVRASIDKLETLVAGDYWPYPRYTDLLFSV